MVAQESKKDEDRLSVTLKNVSAVVPFDVSMENLAQAFEFLLEEIETLNIVIRNLNRELEKLEDENEMYREEESFL